MAWELSSTGFLMTLSGYIPDLIQEDFERLVSRALESAGKEQQQVDHWCIHPGGKKILEAIHKSLHLQTGELLHSYEVLKEYGNMSSPTILFVLERIMKEISEKEKPAGSLFGAAFGPGLTMETFTGTWR